MLIKTILCYENNTSLIEKIHADRFDSLNEQKYKLYEKSSNKFTSANNVKKNKLYVLKDTSKDVVFFKENGIFKWKIKPRNKVLPMPVLKEKEFVENKENIATNILIIFMLIMFGFGLSVFLFCN